jgi:hypothetical protein
LLLAGAIALGPQLESTPQSTPQSPVATAALAPVADASAALPSPAETSAPAQTPAEPASAIVDAPADIAEAPSHPAFHPPNAMAHDTTDLDAAPLAVNPPHPRSIVSAKALAKPEVIISVSVDSQGHAQEFRVLRGDQHKASAALNVARHWSFQPCARSSDCEQLLKFTDYGDASVLHSID